MLSRLSLNYHNKYNLLEYVMKYIISIVELTNEVTFGYAIFNVRIELGKVGSHHLGHHRWILGKGSTSIMDNRYGVN